MKKIYVLDPGKATGLAVVYYDTEKNEIIEYETFELDQMETCTVLENIQHDSEDVEIVFEKFFITTETGKKNDVHYSLEIIGVIRYFAWKYQIPLYSQSPSDAKNFCDNKRLKNVDLWHVGGEGHAKDALRHLVLHLVKNRNWRPEGLLK